MKEAFPEGCKLPNSHYAAKKYRLNWDLGMSRSMCVSMIVVYSGKRLERLNNVMFMGKAVGLTKTLKGKRSSKGTTILSFDTFSAEAIRLQTHNKRYEMALNWKIKR